MKLTAEQVAWVRADYERDPYTARGVDIGDLLDTIDALTVERDAMKFCAVNTTVLWNEAADQANAALARAETAEAALKATREDIEAVLAFPPQGYPTEDARWCEGFNAAREMYRRALT